MSEPNLSQFYEDQESISDRVRTDAIRRSREMAAVDFDDARDDDPAKNASLQVAAVSKTTAKQGELPRDVRLAKADHSDNGPRAPVASATAPRVGA